MIEYSNMNTLKSIAKQNKINIDGLDEEKILSALKSKGLGCVRIKASREKNTGIKEEKVEESIKVKKYTDFVDFNDSISLQEQGYEIDEIKKDSLDDFAPLKYKLFKMVEKVKE